MRKNRVKLLISIFAVTALVLLAAIVVIVVGKKSMDEYKAKLADLEAELNANQLTVYVASADITAGEKLEENINIYQQTIYTGLDESYYINFDDVGGIARIDIPAGEPISKSAVTTLGITEDTREYEISVASLMTNQKEYEYVDVRIMFPNGEDYIVLSKKPVRNLNLENCVFFTYMNEDEILRMASATIDAFTVSGTKIYTTRYVESSLQKDATPNYLIKAETMDIVNRDPNIVKIATETMNLQARMDLESRLKGLTEEQLKAVLAGHEIEDTAKTNVLLGSSYYTAGAENPLDEYATDVAEEGYSDDTTEDSGEAAPAAESEPEAYSNTKAGVSGEEDATFNIDKVETEAGTITQRTITKTETTELDENGDVIE